MINNDRKNSKNYFSPIIKRSQQLKTPPIMCNWNAVLFKDVTCMAAEH